MDTQTPRIRELREVFEELDRLVHANREGQAGQNLAIKDFRRLFDQESAKMNQAIFNDQSDQVRESCLRAIIPLLEILSRA